MRKLKTPLGRALQEARIQERRIIQGTYPGTRRWPSTPLGPLPTADEQIRGRTPREGYSWDCRKSRKF